MSSGGRCVQGERTSRWPVNGPEEPGRPASPPPPAAASRGGGGGVSGRWFFEGTDAGAGPREEGSLLGGGGRTRAGTRSCIAWLPGGNRNGFGTRAAECSVNICSQLQPDGSRQDALAPRSQARKKTDGSVGREDCVSALLGLRTPPRWLRPAWLCALLGRGWKPSGLEGAVFRCALRLHPAFQPRGRGRWHQALATCHTLCSPVWAQHTHAHTHTHTHTHTALPLLRTRSCQTAQI